MAPRQKALQKATLTAPIIGFGQRLSAAADARCNSTFATNEKQFVPSLIFPKRNSDTFDPEHLELGAEAADPGHAISRC